MWKAVQLVLESFAFLMIGLQLPKVVSELAGTPFPGRPQLVFLTFVVVVGTLLLHGLTLPWLIRRLGVTGGEAGDVLRSVLRNLDLEEATLNSR